MELLIILVVIIAAVYFVAIFCDGGRGDTTGFRLQCSKDDAVARSNERIRQDELEADEYFEWLETCDKD